MFKTYLTTGVFLITCVGFNFCSQAQTASPSENLDTNDAIIFEQEVYGRNGLISNYSTLEESGVFKADDLKMDSNMGATRITVYGLQPRENLMEVLEGFDLIIYGDNSGKPDGNPYEIGSGLLEIRNLDPDDSALTVTQEGDVYFNFSVDIPAINQGNAFEFIANKIYWICAYTRLSIAPSYSYDESWKWRTGTPPSNPLAVAHTIDPDNRYNEGTDWIPSTTAGLAFSIEGGSLTVSDNPLNTISVFPNPVKNYLNINFPSDLSMKHLNLYDILGTRINVVYKDGFLDLSALATGIYILVIETNFGKLNRKIIKE
jgi:hypothetical protein